MRTGTSNLVGLLLTILCGIAPLHAATIVVDKPFDIGAAPNTDELTSTGEGSQT